MAGTKKESSAFGLVSYPTLNQYGLIRAVPRADYAKMLTRKGVSMLDIRKILMDQVEAKDPASLTTFALNHPEECVVCGGEGGTNAQIYVFASDGGGSFSDNGGLTMQGTITNAKEMIEAVANGQDPDAVLDMCEGKPLKEGSWKSSFPKEALKQYLTNGCQFHFDIQFEEYNYDEDKGGTNGAKAQKEAENFDVMKGEDSAVKEAAKMFRGFRLTANSHDSYGNLDMEISQNITFGELAKALDVCERHEGSEGMLNLNTPYYTITNVQLIDFDNGQEVFEWRGGSRKDFDDFADEWQKHAKA